LLGLAQFEFAHQPLDAAPVGLQRLKPRVMQHAAHPFVERLIGTLRREYLDRAFFGNSSGLAQKLIAFGDYCNVLTVHRSLDGTTPAQCARSSSPKRISLEHHAWRQHCGGLLRTPVAA
jgi:putative transposase